MNNELKNYTNINLRLNATKHICLDLYVEHYFILLATVLMAPESMHASTKKLFKKKIDELEFPEAKTLKTKFMEALLNMRESDAKESTCTARLKTKNYIRQLSPVGDDL